MQHTWLVKAFVLGNLILLGKSYLHVIKIGQTMKLAVILILIGFLAGCTSMNAKQILGAAAGNAAKTQVKYGKQCYALKNQCVQGEYQEWKTSDGVEGCSCKKL